MIEKEDNSKKPLRGVRRILATRLLSPGQKEMLRAGGFYVTDYNAITVNYLQAAFPPGYNHLIFSSKNGVKAYFSISDPGPEMREKKGIHCYCVGKKTARLLIKNGFEVETSMPDARSLAEYIIANRANERFIYCCGTRRREELPELLRVHGVSLEELVVYTTELNPQKIDGRYDAVLFFSPSGVESFFQSNALHDATAWCIGPTTARAVSKYTDRYTIGPEPDSDSLIKMIINTLDTSNY